MSCCQQGLTSLLYLVSTDMYMLINYVSFVNWLAIGLSVVALLYFRYTRPNMARPIKVVLILMYCSIWLLCLVAFVCIYENWLTVETVEKTYLRNRGCVYVLKMFFFCSPQKYQTTVLGNG